MPKLPNVICLTEHHLKELEIENLSIDHYTLGAKFCRQTLKQGGSSIFVHNSLDFNTIDLHEISIEQDIEIFAVKIKFSPILIYVISIYRSPTGNFTHFIEGIDKILNQLSRPSTEIIVCGDININYLDENCNKRQKLDTLLATYNLISTVQFPTRNLNGSISAIDNIFIDTSHTDTYTIYPLINGLSDHDGQIIQLENISIQKHPKDIRITCSINRKLIQDFNMKLSYEIWDEIFGENDVNKIFNNFHNTFLRVFYSSFPIKKTLIQKKDNNWLTKGIKVSTSHKRELYLKSRHSKNPALKKYYKSYCRLLVKVIKEAKNYITKSR